MPALCSTGRDQLFVVVYLGICKCEFHQPEHKKEREEDVLSYLHWNISAADAHDLIQAVELLSGQFQDLGKMVVFETPVFATIFWVGKRSPDKELKVRQPAAHTIFILGPKSKRMIISGARREGASGWLFPSPLSWIMFAERRKCRDEMKHERTLTEID